MNKQNKICFENSSVEYSSEEHLTTIFFHEDRSGWRSRHAAGWSLIAVDWSNAQQVSSLIVVGWGVVVTIARLLYAG